MFKRRVLRLLAAGVVVVMGMGLAAGQAAAARGINVTNGVALWFAQGQVTVNVNGVNVVCTWRLGLDQWPLVLKNPLAALADVQLTGVGGSSITGCNFNPMVGIILNGNLVGYTGFTGTLPRITSILGRANSFKFQYSIPGLPPGVNCLWDGPLNFTFARNAATGQITGVTINGTLPCTVGGCLPAVVNGVLAPQMPAPVVALI
jgi:hypothetical protein